MNTGSLPEAGAAVQLFEPLAIRDLRLKNRVVVSAMSMYSSRDGFSDDFHLVHIGRFALGGAGLVFMEASAVGPEGCITPGCNGLWLDDHAARLRRITDFLHRFDCAAGIQLGHSGAKGSARRPWHGGTPLNEEDRALRGEQPWPIASASAVAFDKGWAVPHALGKDDIDRLVEAYRHGARRARDAGFDVLELHCAHGYLLHSFLSPLTNQRDDEFGGNLENRMRLPLRIAQVIRAEWPERKPVFVRISSVDGIDVGWTLDESVVFARQLAARGIDAIDCSSGGVILPRDKQLVSRTPGFQVPFAERIRREAGVPTVAVGLILDASHAEAILQRGEADLVALAREILFNPNWPAQAALSLVGEKGWKFWPDQFRWWLERRARQIGDKRIRQN